MSTHSPTFRPRGAKRARASVFALNDANPLLPYLFLLPHALLFFAFVLYPIGYGLWIATHNWDPLADTQPFVGLSLFSRLFDPATQQAQLFWKSLVNTAFFVLYSVPLVIAVSLGLALQLQRPVWGRSVFRAIFFLPGILSVTVVGVLGRWLFEERNGLVNVIVTNVFGGQALQFLTTEGLAWLPVVLMTVWWTIGFNFTLYLAALNSVPETYYEAASLEGASGWHQFRHITWPLISPTTLFVAVTTVLSSFNLFGQSSLITGGGPTRSTQSVIQYIQIESQTNGQPSSATAMAFVFGLVMMVFTVLQFRMTARDVQAATR